MLQHTLEGSFGNAPASVNELNIDICKMFCLSNTPIYRLEMMLPVLKKRIVSGGKISNTKNMYKFVPKVYEELDLKFR